MGPRASGWRQAPPASASRGPASPALMTPWTPVSWMQRSTSRRHWMFPLANTGMATAFLSAAGGHSEKKDSVPSPPRGRCSSRHTPSEQVLLGPGSRAPLHAHSPHGLDVLPGCSARQGPLLLLGAPVHGQQLEHSDAQLYPARGRRPPGPAHSVPAPQSPGLQLVGCCPGLPRPTGPPNTQSRQAQPCSRASLPGNGSTPAPKASGTDGQAGTNLTVRLVAGGEKAAEAWHLLLPSTSLPLGSLRLTHPHQASPRGRHDSGPPWRVTASRELLEARSTPHLAQGAEDTRQGSSTWPCEPTAPHLAASLLQHLGVLHSLVNLREDTDFACDGDREFLVCQQNWGKGESASEKRGVHFRQAGRLPPPDPICQRAAGAGPGPEHLPSGSDEQLVWDARPHSRSCSGARAAARAQRPPAQGSFSNYDPA